MDKYKVEEMDGEYQVMVLRKEDDFMWEKIGRSYRYSTSAYAALGRIVSKLAEEDEDA